MFINQKKKSNTINYYWPNHFKMNRLLHYKDYNENNDRIYNLLVGHIM